MPTTTAPFARNDFYTLLEDSANNSLDIRDNDFILPTNPATYHIQSLPSNGTLKVSVQSGDPLVTPVLGTAYDGPMEYSPDPSFVGSDEFTYYLVNDLAEQSNIATVTLTVRAKRPTGPTDWATNLLNNGPQGGPNRIDPTVDRQNSGWAWGEKPGHEEFNGWQYNISQLLNWSADAVERIDSEINSLKGTNNFEWTIGLQDASAKYLYAGSTLLLNPYIRYFEGKWRFSDTGSEEFEQFLEHPDALDEDDVRAIVLEILENLESSGATTTYLDLRPNGVLTESQALALASAQVANPSQGDLLAFTYTASESYYYGNGTSTRNITVTSNYIFTSGAWTKI